MKRVLPFCLLLSSLSVAAADTVLPRSPAPADAAVYFIAPEDGARVTSPFVVRFGLRGMGVAPAGVPLQHTGHHHLLVDLDTPPAEGLPLPNDARHLHFGKGQTETTLTLPPGRHTLQLMLGDHLHLPHQPPVVSERITVTVE
jgi:hypothetical protein